MIHIACNHCGAKLKAPEEAVGKSLRCPKCEGWVMVEIEALSPPPIPEMAEEPKEVGLELPTTLDHIPEAELEPLTKTPSPLADYSGLKVTSLKLSCDCGQEFAYDHTEADNRFNCRWCGQLLAMPQFDDLTSEDRTYYRNELQKQKDKAERAAEKVETKQRLARKKYETKLEKQRERELRERKRAEAAKAKQLREAEKAERYAEAVRCALSDPGRSKLWWCIADGTEHGLLQEAMVQKWIDDGRLGPTDYVRVEDTTTWIYIKDIPERFHTPLPSSSPSSSTVKCPRCGCTEVSANNKGFGLGKAAVGALLVGPVGLLGGLAGRKKIVITCLKCGHQWSPSAFN